jgi:tagatose 1,6-diphosphate aldolase
VTTFFDATLKVGEVINGTEVSLLLTSISQEDPERDWVPCYHFAITRSRDLAEVGRISLRVGDTESIRLYAGHIGYSIHEVFRGNKYSGKAALLLCPLALRHGMTELWITTNPENLASRRVCEWIGATYVETVDVPPHHEIAKMGEHQKCRYLWRV